MGHVCLYLFLYSPLRSNMRKRMSATAPYLRMRFDLSWMYPKPFLSVKYTITPNALSKFYSAPLVVFFLVKVRFPFFFLQWEPWNPKITPQAPNLDHLPPTVSGRRRPIPSSGWTSSFPRRCGSTTSPSASPPLCAQGTPPLPMASDGYRERLHALSLRPSDQFVWAVKL